MLVDGSIAPPSECHRCNDGESSAPPFIHPSLPPPLLQLPFKRLGSVILHVPPRSEALRGSGAAARAMERSRGVTVAVAEVSNEEWLESSSASVAEPVNCMGVIYL